MTSVQDEPASPPEPVHRDLEETNTATQRARLPRVVGDTQVDVIAPAQAIGRYMVLSQVGVGGMGQVYAAYDPRLDRRVALKLLHTRGTKVERERLVGEAKALARLSHPNVVTVHEVDEHRGHVLLAMEFVAGTTLKHWLRGHPVGTQGRSAKALDLLLQAGRGLLAAHEAGLVHRDFKPANVLVGQDGRVRVADFGLARVVQQIAGEMQATEVVSETDVEVTRSGAVMGTPAYMAPEQIRGKTADTRTDQFSFCVTAWEVMFGQRPVVGERLTKSDTAVVPHRLEAALRKGLSARPGGRHAGMEEVLEAFEFAVEELQGRVPRKRLRPIFRAVGAVAVITGLGFGGIWLHDARVKAACAKQADAIDLVWNAESRTAVRNGLLATGVTYAEDVATRVMPWVDRRAETWRQDTKNVCLNEALHGTWDEELLDRAHWCLDKRRLELATLVAELANADDKGVQNAIASAAELSGSHVCADEAALAGRGAPPEQHLRPVVGELREQVSRVWYLRHAGRYDEGLLLAQAVGERARALEWAPLTAAVGIEEARLLALTGAYPDAERVGIAAYMQAASSGTWDKAALAANELAANLNEQHRYPEGLEWAKHAAVAITHAGDPLGLLEAKRLLHSGALYRALARHPEAMAVFEQALEAARRALGDEHPGLGPYLSERGKQHREMGEHREAKVLLEEVLAVNLNTLGGNHPDIAIDLTNLGSLRFATGDYQEARALYQRALDIQIPTLGPDHIYVAYALEGQGVAAYAAGSPDEAKALLQRALEIQETAAVHPLGIAGTLNNLGVVHRSLGDYAQARPLYERALAIKTDALGQDHPDTASSMSNLGNLLNSLGEFAKARTLHERALRVNEEVLGHEHPDTATSAANLAIVYNSLKDYERAVSAFARSIRIREKTLGPDNHKLAYPLTGLANTLLHLEQYPAAIQHLERANKLRSSPDAPPGLVAETQFTLARALWDAAPPHRDRDRALELAARARTNYSAAGETANLAKATAWLGEHADPS